MRIRSTRAKFAGKVQTSKHNTAIFGHGRIIVYFLQESPAITPDSDCPHANNALDATDVNEHVPNFRSHSTFCGAAIAHNHARPAPDWRGYKPSGICGLLAFAGTPGEIVLNPREAEDDREVPGGGADFPDEAAKFLHIRHNQNLKRPGGGFAPGR